MKKDGASWVHLEPLTGLHENSIPESVCHDFWPGLITLPRAWVNICKLNEITRGFFGSELSAPLYEKLKFVLGFFPVQMQVKQALEMPREVPTYRHLVNMYMSPHPASS
jgi:hypothetical protein